MKSKNEIEDELQRLARIPIEHELDAAEHYGKMIMLKWVLGQ